jgi:hypothetical protein
MKCFLTVVFLFFSAGYCTAQSLLQRKVNISIARAPLSSVLKSVEKQGDFYFSYNSNLINGDSLVSVHYMAGTVEGLLKHLFGSRFQYRESDRYIVIVAANQLQTWYVSGFISDFATGLPIANATVYETRHLASAMTDDKGYFKLQLKEQPSVVDINISKISYADTIIQISAAAAQNVSVSITPVSYSLDSIVIGSKIVESTWLAKMLISSRQRMNSLNLGGFISQQPFQFSLTPGLGTHGRMGSQVIDRFSMNIIGGYTAGIDGFELGSVFNIVKNDVRYVQVGGVFNMVGGNTYGAQLGGVYNQVMGSVEGVQVGGVANISLGSVNGAQIAGVYGQASNMEGVQVGGIMNLTKDTFSGVQVAGVLNYAKNVDGVQVAGVLNNANEAMAGVQISGVINRTKHLKGAQIGLINFADTSEGYSIGLLNIVKKGYHKLSISSTDLNAINIGFKSGNHRLYGILMAGASINSNNKSFSAGYGFGTVFRLSNRFSFNPEAINSMVYTGDIENVDYVTRLHLHARYTISRGLTIFAGPAISLGYINQKQVSEGYINDISKGLPSMSLSNDFKCWIGWSAGVDIF